jgi:hypothetical protein
VFDKEETLSSTLLKNTFNIHIDKRNAFIFTLSDLHIGMGNKQYIEDIINFINKFDNAYVVIGGDVTNNNIRGSKGSTIEEYISGEEQIKLAVELLTPIKDKILAFIEGNHEHRTLDCAYISITQMIATLLGIPDKYKYELAIGYISVGDDNCYTYVDLHKHRKANNYYEFYNADCLVLEHTHEYKYEEKPEVYHNKYTKKPSIRMSYIINNGSALAFPSYAKRAGYSLQNIGTYVIELSGTKRSIKIWKDRDLYDAIERGYK